MPVKKTKREKYVKLHNDGTAWARGTMIDGQPDGCFEWFRKDSTLMRSGSFSKGKQIGKWTTYDRDGDIVKITRMK